MRRPLRIPVKLSYRVATESEQEKAQGPMAETLTRTIRVTPEQWERIEKIAGEREVSANRLVVELVMEELTGSDRGALFDRAAEDARIAQIKALGTERSTNGS